ncbi:MAG: ribonuclease P protein component [candidate division KSB1 bacterium]|nr:ribonuclease P protein component [candidate division KSB1 bacterium]
MPKSRILRGRFAFERVFRVGEHVRSGAVEAWLERGEEDLRVGFAVSARIRTKVRRNRARRRLREAFRRVQGEFQISGNLVLMALPGVVTTEWGAVLRDVQEVARKLRDRA